jgi:hypothetical protein
MSRYFKSTVVFCGTNSTNSVVEFPCSTRSWNDWHESWNASAETGRRTDGTESSIERIKENIMAARCREAIVSLGEAVKWRNTCVKNREVGIINPKAGNHQAHKIT